MPDEPASGEAIDHQRFSLFHDNNDAALRQWHAPYADAFKGAGAQHVADVGCGAGTFLDLVRERGLRGFGVDFDPEMVAAVKRRGHEGVVGDHRTLSSMPDAFDGVHLSHIIEHLWGDEAVELLEGAAVALRPGGFLIVRTPNWANAHVRHGGFWLDHTHKRPYPGELIKKLLADIGFDVTQVSAEPSGWNDTFVAARWPGGRQKNAVASAREQTPSPAPIPATVAQAAAAPLPQPPAVQRDDAPHARLWWRGDFLPDHSFARCNRFLARAIAATGSFDIVPQGEPTVRVEAGVGVPARQAEDVPGDLPAVAFKHQWPPLFRRPKSGHSIHIQPFEFGSIPKKWVRELHDLVDDVWCPTNYVRDLFVDAGVSPERTFVLPWGVDPDVYHPDVEPWDFKSPGTFIFLFVGGTIGRKGIDLLLETYLKTFTRNDNVALVIKGFGSNTFYANHNYTKQIIELTNRTDIAIVGYNEKDLSDAEMASLYRGSDALVLPYRGEGFGLPVLEAMACGTPAIVSAGGATDDFVTDDVGYRIPATRKDIGGTIGGDPLAQMGWLLEADATALARTMRHAYEHRGEVRLRGERAARFVRENYTWAHSARKACARLDIVLSREPVQRDVDDVEAINAYDANYGSSAGEDGVLLEIFGRLRTTRALFVELGTATTNINLLARHFHWSGVVIRNDATAADELSAAFQPLPAVRISHARFDPANAAAVVAASGISGEIDLLSIATDDRTAALWEALHQLRPRAAVVALGTGDNASMNAVHAAAGRLGYALIGSAAHNAAAYFVRRDLLALCEFPELHPNPDAQLMSAPPA